MKTTGKETTRSRSLHVFLVLISVCLYLCACMCGQCKFFIKVRGWEVALAHCCGVRSSIFQQVAAHRVWLCRLSGIDGQKPACRCRSDCTWPYWYSCKQAKIWFTSPRWFRDCYTRAMQHFVIIIIIIIIILLFGGYWWNNNWTLNLRKMCRIGVCCSSVTPCLFRLVVMVNSKTLKQCRYRANFKDHIQLLYTPTGVFSSTPLMKPLLRTVHNRHVLTVLNWCFPHSPVSLLHLLSLIYNTWTLGTSCNFQHFTHKVCHLH